MLFESDIERWLREDVGHHDVTNDLPGETRGELLVKEPGTVAGLEAATAVFEYLDVAVLEERPEGTAVAPGDVLLAVEGSTRDVLRGERPAVNLVAHLSGVATATATALERARTVSESVRIAATRKTTPGLRGLEKRAVAAAGGDTHRLDLSHMVMVKDNHVATLGLEGAIERTRDRTSFATKVEVEVETVEEARRAAAAGADVVMLDNASAEQVGEAVDVLDDTDVILEASGGIGLEDVRAYAETGVDVISLGTLTHSAPALDCSFQLQ